DQNSQTRVFLHRPRFNSICVGLQRLSAQVCQSLSVPGKALARPYSGCQAPPSGCPERPIFCLLCSNIRGPNVTQVRTGGKGLGPGGARAKSGGLQYEGVSGLVCLTDSQAEGRP